MKNPTDATLRERMIARLAERGPAEMPGLDGQFLAARRVLGEDPDSYFALELSDGEWVLEWVRDRDTLARLARAGLERYAEAALAARSRALAEALNDPLPLLAASELLDLPVDIVAAAVRSGTLAASESDGIGPTIAFVDLLAWGNAHGVGRSNWFQLDPTLEVG